MDTFGYKEGAPGKSGAVGGKPSPGASLSWLFVLNSICLVGLVLGHTTTPYLDRIPSYLLVGRKFGHRGTLSLSLVFCRISLAAGWYYNLNSYLQASVPCPLEDTVAMQWHKRILSNFYLGLED